MNKTILILLITMISLFNCNSKNKNPDRNYSDTVLDEEAKVILTEEIEEEEIINIQVPVIDSIKMHAFDNIYFGNERDYSYNPSSINGMKYNLTFSKYVKDKLFYFILYNETKFETEKKAKTVINDLKKIISKKYENAIEVSKFILIKHPEEKNKNESALTRDWLYNYDKKLIGRPYEFQAYKWELPYKQIKIGYFIDYKDKTKYLSSEADSDSYIIYIEFTSKIILEEKIQNNGSDLKNTDKF